MNSVVLSGRLTRDPEIRHAQDTTVARFTLAVERRWRADNQPSADFPSVVAFGKAAEFVEKYARQGVKFNVRGRIQTGSYKDRDGKNVYTTDVIAEEIEFAETKKQEAVAPAAGQDLPEADDFMQIPDSVDDEGLPF